MASERRLNATVEIVHIATVGKEGQHRSTHCHMDVYQHVLKRIKIGIAVARIRDIAGHDNGHVRVEVVARIEMERRRRTRTDAVEPDGVVEVVEILGNRHGRRGENRRLYLGKPRIGQSLADIEALSAERLAAGLEASVHLKRIDIALVGALVNQFEVLAQLMQLARKITEVDGGFGAFLGKRAQKARKRLVGKLELGERVFGLGGQLVPRIRFAHVGADPQVHRVITGLDVLGERTHAVEQVGHSSARLLRCRDRFGGELGAEPALLACRNLSERRCESTCTIASEALEDQTRFVGRDLERPLATCLGLDRVSLVDHPMPDGRQDLAFGRNVSEQQGMVGDHDVGAGRTAAGAVHQALVGKERAEPSRALARTGRKIRPVHASPANTESIEVAVGHLTHVGIYHGDRRQRIGRVLAGLDLGDAPAHTLELAQARIVIVALERVIAQTAVELFCEFWQLVVHELVGKVVRFGRHADGHAVALGGLGKGDEVRHGFADARAGLDHAMGAGLDRLAYLECHGDLLLARLVGRVHPVHQTPGRIGALELSGCGHSHERQFIGIDLLGRGLGVEYVHTRLDQREGSPRIFGSEEREDRTITPWHIGVHVRQAAAETGGKIAQCEQEDAPHAGERRNVIVRTVRDGSTAEKLGHERELVRGETGQGDARERKRIDPDIAHLHAALHGLDERAVERRVVCNDWAAADKIPQCRNSLDSRGSVGHIRIGDTRQFCYFCRYKTCWVHKGVECVNNLAPTQASGRDLDQLAILEREPRRLRVEHDHVVLDQRKIPRLRAFLERRIRLDHECRRSRHHGFFD